jgi:hypothetical protein
MQLGEVVQLLRRVGIQLSAALLQLGERIRRAEMWLREDRRQQVAHLRRVARRQRVAPEAKGQ